MTAMGRTSDAKERLIAAMAGLVHRRGYFAVGVDDVCRAAGVKKGSFYHFFPSKRDLMLAALDRQWETGSDHVFSVAFAPDKPPLVRIGRLLETVAELETFAKAHGGHVLGCPFGNVVAEVGASEPSLTRRADQAFCGLAALIGTALREAKRLGHIGANTDVDEAADAIVAYFEGLAVLAKARNDPSLIRRLGPRAVQLAILQDRPAAGRGRRQKAPATRVRARR
jgi:TetR/AcrR family transcriptional repressor of nem operon